MVESADQTEQLVEAHAGSPEALVAQVVESLCELLGAGGEERDSHTVVPIEATGATLEEMLHGLVADMLDNVGASSAQVVDAEISHVMTTQDGVRAWGYLWFGMDHPTNRSPSLAGPPRVTTLSSGELNVRMTLLVSDAPVDHGAAVAKAPSQR